MLTIGPSPGTWVLPQVPEPDASDASSPQGDTATDPPDQSSAEDADEAPPEDAVGPDADASPPVEDAVNPEPDTEQDAVSEDAAPSASEDVAVPDAG